MTTGPVHDSDLTAWLCTHLPVLTVAAAQDRWSHLLIAAIIDIRAGTPATQALANHHLPVDVAAASHEQARISRGDPGVLNDLNINPVTVTGAYTCPAQPPALPCPRRSRPDPDGHEPRCGVHEKTMTLRRAKSTP